MLKFTGLAPITASEGFHPMIERIRTCSVFSVVLLLMVSLISGCSSSPSNGSILIAGGSSTLVVGGTMQLHATDTNFLHVVSDATATATWSSSNPAIVSVNSTGLVTGVTTGYATVRAQLGQDSGAFVVTITSSSGSGSGGGGGTTGSTLTLSPANANLFMGGAQAYSATLTSSGGTVTNVTSSTTWNVTPASVATINSTGMLTPVGPGNYLVSGTNGGVTGTALGTVSAVTLTSLAVTPATSTLAGGMTEQLTAIGTYNDGSSRDLTKTVAWSSSASTALTVDANGLATAASTSASTSVTVSATLASGAASVTGTATVQVTPDAYITDLVVRPTSSSIATGSAEQHTATAWYSDGTQQDVTKQVTWTSTNSGTSAVNSSGINVAATPGVTTLQATISKTGALFSANAVGANASPQATANVQSSSVVIVTPATVTSLDIGTSKAQFPIGSTQPIKLIGTFSDGSTQDLSLSANWQSLDPSIATIDSTGVATGVSAGKVVFTANFGGLVISTDGFEVLPTDLISTTVSVDYAGQITGLSEQLHVIGTYADGSTHDLTGLASFVSSDATIFAVNSTGLANGIATGVAQITATVAGFSAITNVDTYVETISTMGVFPQQPRFALGTHLQLAASITADDPITGVFSQDVTGSAVWTSSDPTVLTIDQNGLAKSGKVGTTTVFATVLGTTKYSDTITVTNAQLQKIVLSKQPASIAMGTANQYYVTGFFDDGSVQDLTLDAVWNTDDNTIASVDKDGTTLGLKPGQTQVTASMAGKTATAALTVTGATLVSTSLLPGNVEVPINFYTQYSMIGTFSDGTTQNLNYGTIFQSPTPFIASFFPVGLGGTNYPGIGQLTGQYGYFSASTPITVSNANLTSVTLSPAKSTIRVGDSQQLTTTGIFDDGLQLDLGGEAYLISSAPLIAPATRTGLIYGTSVGTSTFTANMYGTTATATVTVLSNVLTSLTLAPNSPAVVSGSTQQLVATGIYQDGSTDDLTNSVTWTSSNPSLLSVNASGLAMAAAGTTSGTSVTVTATAAATLAHPAVTSSFVVTIQPSGSGGTGGGGTTSPTAMQVTPTRTHLAAGTTKQLTATATYADGTTKDISSTVTWTSTNPLTATVSSTGLVTAVKTGTVSVQAQTGTLSSSSIVVVSSATLQSLAISPSGATFAAGATQQFTLTGTYTDGTTQDLSSGATWSTSNAAVATVSSTGLATGVGPGTVQFSASYGSLTATSASNTVTPLTLVSITLTPTNPSFAKGTTQQFTVTGTYSDGSTRDITSSSTFAASNPSVVSVSTTGLATGAGVGSAQITVSVGGQTASTQSVTVTPAVLASITVTPKDLSFADGTTQQFTAIGTFTDGTTQDLTHQVVWSSSDAQAITIDQNGVATGGSVGSAQITATMNSVSASTDIIKVTPATLISLILSPTTVQLAKGTTQQFVATGVFSDGSSQNLSSTVTWTSSNGAIASVDGNGLATGTGTGSAQVTASYQGKMASTTSFTVTPATLVSLSFNPANPTVASGTSTHVTVLGVYSDGTTQNLTSTATFSSSNTTVASVGAAGVINGNLPGSSTITVSAGGQTGSFDVAVSAAVLTSLTITPANPPAFAKGTTLQFTATGTFSDGTTQNLSTSATWVSSNTSVFTIDGNGLASGVGVGSASLTATAEGQVAMTPAFQVTPAVVASIAVSPQSQTVTAGTLLQYSAVATYTDSSTADVSSSAVWASSNTAAATINATGLATSVAAGSTTISATVGSVTGDAGLTVNAGAVTLSSITVAPSSASIAKGNTQQFTATGTYSDGSTRNVSTTVTWQSSVTAVATIDGNGLATSVAGGNTQIWASLSGRSAMATLSVSPATLVSLAVTPQTASVANGTTQQYKAVGTLSDGSTQDLTTSVTWSSSSSAQATINASGLASTTGTGMVTITAQAGSASSSATLTVTSATVTSLQITPSPVSVPAGGSVQLLATATFSDGSSQNVTSSVTYSSSNPAVVTVDSNGKLKAVGPGNAVVTATLGGTTVMLPVTIGNATVTSITITPANPSLAAGTSQQLTATATYSDGSTQDLTNAVTWSSSDPGAVSVNTTGNITAAQPGTATVTATYGGATGSVNVTGTAAVATAISVSPANATLAAGQTKQFAATATMSDGTQQTVTTSVHWGVSDPSKASVSDSAGSNGLLTATAAGSLNVIASLNGVSGPAAVTVQAATLSSLTINPSAVISLPAGTTEQLSVTGAYSDGSSADVTSLVTWSSSQASTAYVDASAVLHTGTSGLTTIDAKLQGVDGTAAVTVGNATLSSIAITPAAPVLALGQTQQLTATGTYSDGSTANITTQVQWNSSAPAVATVSGGGLVSSLTTGSAAVTATLNGVSQQTPVTVTSATLQSIAVQSPQSSFALGTSLQLKALGFYSDGSTQDLTNSVTWSSQTPAVGVISSTGVATGVSAGTFNARASLNGVTGSTPITVTSAVLVSLAVTPNNQVILNVTTTTVQFTATGTFSDGSTQNLTNSAHWGTSGIVVGSISSTGVFSPTGVGVGTVTATSGSVTGSTQITVVSVPLI
ncbi:beta strand repeat-containing protein [Granulicella tundricola]|nr:Ig-like domain-containing protein [Granulicella tundricola]